jgi:hypothetical protein
MTLRKEKGRRSRMYRDMHDETCLCLRCRSRLDAQDRKDVNLDWIRSSEDARALIQYTEDE